MILLQKESHVNQVIPDKGSLHDGIHIHHAVAIQSLKVGVDITHPFIGDLKLELTSPAGTTAVLHNRAGGSQDNIQKVYEGEILAPFHGESVQGTWTLTVSDFAPRDTGTLNHWNLEITCEHDAAHSEVFIPDGDDAWLVSEQICKTDGIIEDATVDVNIEHPFVSDLIVKLKSPDGEEITLHNRQGGSSDNIVKTYGMDVLASLKGKHTAGVWTLCVRDCAPRDNGTLKSWKVSFSYHPIEDLTKVKGITPELAAHLNSNGIHSYSKLSTLGTAGLREVLAGHDADTEHHYDHLNNLLDQSKLAATGQWEALEAHNA